jgi:hypothetical protein
MGVSRLTTLLVVSCLLVSPEMIAALAKASGTQVSKSQSLRDSQIAARFAPVFYQALGENARSDYITNFNFDGDWRGDNNWAHADDKNLTLKAFVYYSVVETVTHYFLHYAVFHPRDYKGGERKGAVLSELIREGAKRGRRFDPTGLAEEAALAHENDMEGCLVVVRKNGAGIMDARVVFVETLHHNNFSRYYAGEAPGGNDSVKLEDQHPELYIEPKGHGIEAFVGDAKQTAKKTFLRYSFTGTAESAEKGGTCRDLETTPCRESVGYGLLPISTTLWPKAKTVPNATYGETCDYGQVALSLLIGKRTSERKFRIAKVGCAFVGKVGGLNMARPPWGWFDKDERNRPLGHWFFDPASTVKKDFGLDATFSTTYLRLPFWAR